MLQCESGSRRQDAAIVRFPRTLPCSVILLFCLLPALRRALTMGPVSDIGRHLACLSRPASFSSQTAVSNTSKYGCCSCAQLRSSLSHPGKFATKCPFLYIPFGPAGPFAYALMRFWGTIASLARMVPCHLKIISTRVAAPCLYEVDRLTARYVPAHGTRPSGNYTSGRSDRTRRPRSTSPTRHCAPRNYSARGRLYLVRRRSRCGRL